MTLKTPLTPTGSITMLAFSRGGRILLAVGVAVLAAEVVAILLFGWGALPGFVFFLPIILAWPRGRAGDPAR